MEVTAWSRLFEMRPVLLILQADVIQEFRIQKNVLFDRRSSGSPVRFGIVHRHFNLHVPLIDAPEPFGHAGGIC